MENNSRSLSFTNEEVFPEKKTKIVQKKNKTNVQFCYSSHQPKPSTPQNARKSIPLAYIHLKKE